MVFQFQLLSDGRFCIPYASEAIRTIYRLSPEEAYEDAIRLLKDLHPDDRENFKTTFKTSALNLTPWHLEYRLIFNNSPACWLLGNALPQGDVDGSTLFITDITQQKQIETELHLAAATFELQGAMFVIDASTVII